MLGAGAIGGYFGGRLAAAGVDTTFLVRPGRRAQLERDGLVISSPVGDLRIPVRTIDAAELGGDYDVLLLTCKSYDLQSATDAIAPAMTGSCVVVPMLNGMSHFEALDARFGRDQVAGGLCAIMSTMAPDGTIDHLSPLHRIVIGARANSAVDDVCRAFAETLSSSGVEAVHSSRIEEELWAKLVFLSSAAALTCLFRANIAELRAAPGGPEAVDAILDCTMAVAEREGFPLRPAAVEFCRVRLGQPSDITTSMLRDIENGNAVESDHIVGFMLEHARRHGIESSMLGVAYTHLKAYENRRAQRSVPRDIAAS